MRPHVLPDDPHTNPEGEVDTKNTARAEGAGGDVRQDGLIRRGHRRRHHSPADKGVGAVSAGRESMAESQIPRNRRPRRNDPDRPGRSKHDAEGSRAGRTPERKSPMEPKRMGEGAERKGREGRSRSQGKRKRRRKEQESVSRGGGEEREVRKSQAPPEPDQPPGKFVLFEAEPEAELPDVEDEMSMSEEAAENFRRQDRASFQAELAKASRTDLKMSHIGWQFLSMIDTLKTPLGRFYQEFEKHAVAQGGPDLLPVSFKGVDQLSGVNSFVRDWAVMVCLVLNYLFCGQSSNARAMEHGVRLSPRQEQAVRTNIIPAIERMIGENPDVPSVEEIREELERKGQDYDGCRCWPAGRRRPMQQSPQSRTF